MPACYYRHKQNTVRLASSREFDEMQQLGFGRLVSKLIEFCLRLVIKSKPVATYQGSSRFVKHRTVLVLESTASDRQRRLSDCTPVLETFFLD